MAERITITPEELRDSASKFTGKATEIRETLSFLRNEVDSLEATWEGAAQNPVLHFPTLKWSRL